MTMLGQDEHETDTKNRTSKNSTSEVPKPLKMVKKPIQAFESLDFDVRARGYPQITIFDQDEHITDAKNRISTNLASQVKNPILMVKNNMSGFGIAQF